MNRVWCSTLAAFAVLVSASAALAQSSYSLGFSPASSSVSGKEGAAWSATCTATLTSDLAAGGPNAGAQAWSISLTADNANISGFAFAGSGAAALICTGTPEFPQNGFEKSELTTKGADGCVGKNGAVSAVILCFAQEVRLPSGTTTIGDVTLGGTIPASGGSATLRYTDGCQAAGQPVTNRVTENGLTFRPALGSKSINLIVTPDCCGKLANVGFSLEKKASATQYDGILDEGEGLCSGGGATVETRVSLGQKAARSIYVNISENVPDDPATVDDPSTFDDPETPEVEGGVEGIDAVQGWAFSLVVTGGVEISKASTSGTSVSRLFVQGFNKTGVANPALNAGKRGAFSAVVLALQLPVVLPPVGTETVLDLTTRPEGDAAVGMVDNVGMIKFENGIISAAGAPGIDNTLTISGKSVTPCNINTASVNLVFGTAVEPPKCRFVRGNANNDTKVDIGDSIWIINELFRPGSPATACPDAADANDSGAVDAADAVYVIAYQFSGGPAPPAPFGSIPEACGVDPTDDALGLGVNQSSCP